MDNNNEMDNEFDMENEEVETSNINNIVSSPIKQGRKTRITNEAFINAHTNAKSVEDIIAAFPHYQAMDVKKAKTYIAIKASMLRKSHPEMKTFKKGRKNKKKTIFQT